MPIWLQNFILWACSSDPVFGSRVKITNANGDGSHILFNSDPTYGLRMKVDASGSGIALFDTFTTADGVASYTRPNLSGATVVAVLSEQMGYIQDPARYSISGSGASTQFNFIDLLPNGAYNVIVFYQK